MTSSDTFEWISPGFGLRTRDGKKRYVVQYKLGNQQRRMTLRNLSLKEAAKEAKKHLGDVAKGIDPQGVKKAARAESAIGTFGAVVNQFIEEKKGGRTEDKKGSRENTIKAAKLYLETCAKPLHGMKVDQIKRSDIAAVLTTIARERGNSARDRARSALSKCFAWAIGEGQCGDNLANPVDGTNRKYEYVPRNRVLANGEIKAIWDATADGADFSRIVRLLLLTGCRRDEIAKLHWGEVKRPMHLDEPEIDLDALLIPGERTKNHLKFLVPLSEAALEVLGERGEGFVFGRRGTGFSGFSKAKKELDAKLKGVADWSLHDLRRTFSTKLHDVVKVKPHIVEACLNHVSGHKGGVAGTYNHAEYADDKASALDAWAKRINMIVSGVEDLDQHRKKAG